jgi:hypothetical protein
MLVIVFLNARPERNENLFSALTAVPPMVLRDLRQHGSEDGAFAVVFWCLAGLGLGGGLAALVDCPTQAASIAGLMGGLAGACTGLFAALGTSRLARALAFPGILFGIVASAIL